MHMWWLGAVRISCGGVAQGTGAGNRPNWPQLLDISSSVSLPYVRWLRDAEAQSAAE